jgi:adenylate cyclase
MYLAGEEFRKNVPEGVPRIGRTRVGLHYGEAIVGNFGGRPHPVHRTGRCDEHAARLEGANKPLDTTVLVSRAAMERSGLDWFRPMGTITLRGRATPVDVFEPLPDMPAAERAGGRSDNRARRRGQRPCAWTTDKLLEMAHSDDAVLNLLQRLQHTHKGESYVLG